MSEAHPNDLGRHGLWLLPLWLLALYQLGLVTNLRALDSGLCGLSFPCPVFRMFSNLMQCLLGCRFSGSPLSRLRLLVFHRSLPLPVARDPCCLLYCLDQFLQLAAHDQWNIQSAMVGMISSPTCASDTFSRSSSVLHPILLTRRLAISPKFAFPAKRLYVTNSSLSSLKTGSWLHHRSRLCVGEGIIRGSGAVALIAGTDLRSSPGLS